MVNVRMTLRGIVNDSFIFSNISFHCVYSIFFSALWISYVGMMDRIERN